MSRELALFKYLNDNPDLTLSQIAFIKDALKYHEKIFGKIEDDYINEVECAVALYIDHLNCMK